MSLSPILLRRPQNIGLDERPRKKLKVPRHCDEVLSFEYVKLVNERKMEAVVRISGWWKITYKTNSAWCCLQNSYPRNSVQIVKVCVL